MSFITAPGLPNPTNFGDTLVSNGTSFVSSQFYGPTCLTPADAAINQNKTLTLTSSTYYALWSATHSASQWQIATDAAFSSLVLNTGDDAVNKTSYAVSGILTFGQTYYWRVRYKNSLGYYSPYSSAFTFTVAITPVSQIAYTTAGTFTFICPADVPSVCVVAVGGAGSNNISFGESGAGGGGLGYKNNITVIPANSYTVVVGAGNGGDSYFVSTATVKGGGGANSAAVGSAAGGTYTGDGGGDGGASGSGSNSGGGGAGGYAGNGGAGGAAGANGTAGSGGGAGGGGGTGVSLAAGGGGVGILGQGTSGAAGLYVSTSSATGGGGGSSGANGSAGATPDGSGSGGLYGGAASGVIFGKTAGSSKNGAVRIIYGPGRSFPSTNTGNL